MKSKRAAQLDTPNAMTGKRIRRLRLMMGLSQANLAEKIDVTYQQLQKYETGANNINVNMLFRISEALQSPATSFLDNDFNNTTVLVEPVIEPQDERLLIRLNARISKRLDEIHDANISANILKLLESFAKQEDGQNS